MASFISAMNASGLTKEGVKGSHVYTEEGVGDDRVALFQQLVRGVKPRVIKKILAKAKPEHMSDYVVMAFQTRDIRDGKGERDIFYCMFGEITHAYPASATALVRLIPEYGCWSDCWKLRKSYPHLQTAIDDLVKWIYFEDLAKLEHGESVSLLGKWLPREDSKHGAIAKIYADLFYPEIPTIDDRLRAYRKACSALNAQLKTSEINMCSARWAEIKPGAVPGRLLSLCRKAFLNEKILDVHIPHARRNKAQVLRFPENPDRMTCRQNFLDHTAKALKGKLVMKGANVVYPHTLVASLLTGRTSDDEDDMIEAQWRAIRDAAAAKGGLGRAVAMSDFSGSMSGIPMHVSMALGILISELTHSAFRGNFMAFDSTPQWINVADKPTLKEKVKYASRFAQGLSTNFEAAYDLILRRLIEYKVPSDEAPQDLIVLTDMGFDAACGGQGNSYAASNHAYVMTDPWQTHLDLIKGKFASAGYTAPRIVLWNLRAEYSDFHAKADTDGVVVLSGWSPSVLDAITTGKVEIRNPLDGLMELLNEPRYAAVRAIWRLTVEEPAAEASV